MVTRLGLFSISLVIIGIIIVIVGLESADLLFLNIGFIPLILGTILKVTDTIKNTKLYNSNDNIVRYDKTGYLVPRPESAKKRIDQLDRFKDE